MYDHHQMHQKALYDSRQVNRQALKGSPSVGAAPVRGQLACAAGDLLEAAAAVPGHAADQGRVHLPAEPYLQAGRVRHVGRGDCVCDVRRPAGGGLPHPGADVGHAAVPELSGRRPETGHCSG